MSTLILGNGHNIPVEPDDDSTITIKSCRAYVIGGSKEEEEEAGGGADCHAQSHGHWIVDTPIATPCSIYPQYKSSRKSWGIDAMGSVVCEITLTNGMVGYGISIGGHAGCHIIESHLSRFVEGQDPRNVELIWDLMFRSTINYGRKGLPIQALSAVDIAIWDVLGKLRNEPVYMLLGGKTKGLLPIYATSTRPDLSKNMGFIGGKFPLPYGPGDGTDGMKKNIEHIRKYRDAVGPDYPLMIDCYMSLTVSYTIELAHRIHNEIGPNTVKWLEECLMPDDYDGYAEIRKNISNLGILITCGEHEYTRYGMKLLLEKKCIDILQPDITWCGGITEAKRICALASSFDIPVVPHGSSVYSYHLQYSQINTPIAEFLVMSPNADKIVSYFGKLFKDEPLPHNGYVKLDPTKPGFGVTLNKDELNLIRPCVHKELTKDDIKTQTTNDTPVSQEEWLNRASNILP